MSEEKNGEQEEEEREEEEEEEVDDGHDDEQADVKHEPEEAGDLQGIGDKPDGTIVTEHRSGNNDKDDCSDLTDNNDAEEEQAPRSFPQKLMDILSNEEYSDIISWLPHGNGFIIHKKKTFASEILPRYFKASKFTSFTRKLNRWGFARAPRGPETGAYYHKLFHRDKPELCTQMTSNSGNKYQSAPMQSHLLPAMPGMIAPALNPYFIPNPMMVMYPPMVPTMIPTMAAVAPATAAATPQLTPQQQQALWQQQMQLFQLQQYQMMQQQQQQQQAAAIGVRTGVPAPATTMSPASTTIPMPILPTNTNAAAGPVITASSSNDNKPANRAEPSSDEAVDNAEDDALDALNATDV